MAITEAAAAIDIKSTQTATPSDLRSYRLSNIDMLRGLVIIIMALDHVRDYFMLTTELDPLAQADVSLDLYLTRWVTHFCAPVFVFLAGTSAGLMAVRKSRLKMAQFLASRGVWLILVEVLLISTAWTFSPFDGIAQVGNATIFAMQVIWAIGASMLVLAVAQYFGAKACLLLGLIIILGHNSLDAIWPSGDIMSGNNPIWYALHSQSSTLVGPIHLIFAYPLLPWIGIMLVGYGTAFVFTKPAQERNKILIVCGVLMMVLFFILRSTQIYGDPNPWQIHELGLQATILDFMNVTKYPPSLLFTLITLAPMAILCAYADNVKGKFKDMLVMFGRVPFAFYVAHLYLIHTLSLCLGKLQGYSFSDTMTLYFFYPKGFGVNMFWVYVAWLVIVAMLYPFCKWMADIKAKRKDWWLSYL